MTLQTLRAALAEAEAGEYAVGAFNVSSIDQAIAVLDAAAAERSPVIVQSIAGMSAYDDESRWWTRLRGLVEEYNEVPVVLHLDHGRTYDDCVRAIGHGFTSVMIDASRVAGTDRPASFAENVALTRRVIEVATPAGVSVEGELGTIGGAEAGVAGVVEEIVFADPDQAVEFVAQTGVDALAVAVGTSHGSVKFTDEAGGQRLRLELIAEIKDRLPETFLVLHGSSSVPADAVAVINAHGGGVRPSYGISPEQKAEGIAAGIRKINQGTDSHLAWSAALRRFLQENTAIVEPSEQLRPAISGFREMVAQRMREFGSAGRA
ncbi:ketose-bisphosphate aldolase [Microbacterium sp. AK031]|uniref:ketose-bisphosphate aldolase n=1 Tax=Microbacterium sp. AK031 TaxID=2723076 RepID=UPI002168378C|nr:ketose-bisphosphate aldolase [Microbacterium sp. AK031]MCS3843298.1 fructose-bisphosphate aldolase class II [Microbacterium sp. AK031]